MSTPAQPDSTATEPGTQPATPTQPEVTPAPPAPPTPATEPATEPKAKAPKFDGEFDPARFEKLVENLRGDVATEKSKREAAEKKAQDDQAAFMKKVAAAFGLETDEAKPPTPEELAQQLTEEQNRTKASDDRARQTQVELAVYKTASRHGGDPDALLDSRAFATAIAKLDPAAEGFDAKVAEAVQTAVKANPKLAAKAPEPKTPEPTPAGGAPMENPGGGKRQLGEADVKRMSPEQITKAVEEGRFNTYLGRG